MKKLFLLTIATGLTVGSYAQTTAFTIGKKVAGSIERTANKTTTPSDSILLDNTGPTDTTVYTYFYDQNTSDGVDTGYVFGTSLVGANGFAERYDFSSSDSEVQVVGVLALANGAAASPSTHNITFHVWSAGPQVDVRPTFHFSGFPSTATPLGSTASVLYSGVAFGLSISSANVYWLTSATSWLTNSFFVGADLGSYSWASMNGDTAYFYMSSDRVSPIYTVTSGDTMVNNQSTIRVAGNWRDVGYELQSSHDFKGEYMIFPIVNTRMSTVMTNGITKNGFTFFGAYPNPATTSTNVKFALANTTDVTITVMDMTGRAVNTIVLNNQTAGEHVANVETNNLAAGNYIIAVNTAYGAAIATTISVTK